LSALGFVPLSAEGSLVGRKPALRMMVWFPRAVISTYLQRSLITVSSSLRLSLRKEMARRSLKAASVAASRYAVVAAASVARSGVGVAKMSLLSVILSWI